ncbi:hypothetical protein [Saliterribacillus persicus]|uniref:Uncharacterized protein n=1 Tax=Saliterribacillus persicus TaxID=930114 RepID=A0A368YD84_9BACI|nr:hypothetical protein [Saliterribacillus persicus]RCW77398.1 hypothetical protein DFR57_101272 [Saliterribacillus persicus]
MNAKKWLILFILSSIIFVAVPSAVVLGFNYYVDPLWNFDHKNKYNTLQASFNERQQKTNDISNGKFNYQSLLIGTSRTTYINQYEFQEKVYNYGLSGQSILEYPYYISYAQERNNQIFNKIYMEMTFSSFKSTTRMPMEHPDFYFEKSNALFYRYTSLFSYDTLQKSLDNINLSTNDKFRGHRAYHRNNVAITGREGNQVANELDKYAEEMKSIKKEKFPVNKKYNDILLTINNKFSDSEIIPFTDPIPVRKLAAMLEVEAYKEGYEKWYKEMVNHFPKVYSFQKISPITENLEYWIDDSHFTPEAGTMMIKALEDPKGNSNIITVVTKENVDMYLKNTFSELEKQIK